MRLLIDPTDVYVLVMPLNNTVSFKLIFWITLFHLSYDLLSFN